MTLNRLIHFVLLLLFALLQCAAPFAHAHVNGHNSDLNVHFAVSEPAALSNVDSGTSHFSAEQHNSSVICMPPEFRGSDATHQHLDAYNPTPRLVLSENRAILFITSALQTAPSYPYHHPCSQAPPA
jgi:hypothetical protein